jgi:hypothetical protein
MKLVLNFRETRLVQTQSETLPCLSLKAFVAEKRAKRLIQSCDSGDANRYVVCVQVRTRPIRNSLDAVLQGLPTVYLQRLKYEMKLTILIGNFQYEVDDYLDCCLDVPEFRELPKFQ